jgi:hypothetical protein
MQRSARWHFRPSRDQATPLRSQGIPTESLQALETQGRWGDDSDRRRGGGERWGGRGSRRQLELPRPETMQAADAPPKTDLTPSWTNLRFHRQDRISFGDS